MSEVKFTPKLTAEFVAYSSVVGRSVMFKNEAGECVALVMISVPNAQFNYNEMAEPVAHLVAASTDMLAALEAAQAALAMMIEPNSIEKTTLPVAFAQATEAEVKARAAIARARGDQS